MTETQFYKISSILHHIEVLQNLVERIQIPVEIAIREGDSYNQEPKKLYPLYDIYELPNDMQQRIREILNYAGAEIKGYLIQELEQLKDQFSKIEVKDENT